MSVISAAGIYACRIPTALLHVFDDKSSTEALKSLHDIKSLESLLNQEDLFYLLYEQVNHPGFNEFCIDHQVYSISNSEANLSWLSDLETKYSSYTKKRQDQEKINPTSTYPYLRYRDSYKFGDGLLLIFTDVEQTSTQSETIDDKLKIHRAINQYMGYDVFRKHPITKYILGITA